ncbi:unnamed protein product [marine sediment metagenome]|uniref:Uncharacterized protein n=1 Tax=marine sediment metagenome TaxID=412755 RepID=X0T8K7_9ZZZZ
MSVHATQKGIELLTSCMAGLPDGRWVIAKPVPGPFRWRLRDAWRVLWGKAEALYFEGDQ